MYRDPRDLHVLTHPFPTRRSSDLFAGEKPVFRLGHDRSAADHRYTATLRTLRTARQMIYSNGKIDTVAKFCFRSALGRTPLARGISGHFEGRSQIQARWEEHTSDHQSLMRISYAVFCLTKN